MGLPLFSAQPLAAFYLEHLLWVPPLHRAQGDSLGPVEMLNAKALWKIQNLKSIEFKLKSQ